MNKFKNKSSNNKKLKNVIYFLVVMTLLIITLSNLILTKTIQKGNSNILKSETPPGTCEELWSCTAWQSCNENNTKTRLCVDINECGTTLNKPQISQTCTILDKETENNTVSLKTIWILIVIFVIITVILLVIETVRRINRASGDAIN